MSSINDSPDVEKGNDTNPNNLSALALRRQRTHHRQHTETVGRSKPSYGGRQHASIGAGKPFPKQLPDSDNYVVEFDNEHDPLHPQNWSMGRKYVKFSHQPRNQESSEY